MPRRYRGRDIFAWLADLTRHGPAHDVTLPTTEQLPDSRLRFSPMPALSGHRGGHDADLRRYAADGIALTGRLTGARGEALAFADDLEVNLAHADAFFAERLRPTIDTYIERAGLDAPPDDRVAVAFQPPGLTELHLGRAGVSTIVWATGYALNHSWIAGPGTHLPAVVNAVATRARAVAAGGDDRRGGEGSAGPPARARVRTPSGRWLLVRGSVLGEGPGARTGR